MNSGVRSMAVTRQPHVAAMTREQPPTPHPRSKHVHARIDTSPLDMLARSFDSAPVKLIERKERNPGRSGAPGDWWRRGESHCASNWLIPQSILSSKFACCPHAILRLTLVPCCSISAFVPLNFCAQSLLNHSPTFFAFTLKAPVVKSMKRTGAFDSSF